MLLDEKRQCLHAQRIPQTKSCGIYSGKLDDGFDCLLKRAGRNGLIVD